MPAITFILFVIKRERVIGWQKYNLFIYLLLTLITLSVTELLTYLHIHNLVLYHIYTLIEFTLISRYIILETGSPNLKRLYPWFVVVFGIICMINAFYIEPFSKDYFNSYTATLSGMALLVLAMFYIFLLSKSDAILAFHTLPSFWIVTAFLVSSAISIPLIIKYSDYTTDPSKYADGDIMWFIIDISNILKFVLICIGLLCYKKPPVASQLHSV